MKSLSNFNYFCLQRVCQGERTCREPASVLQAEAPAADRERAQRLPGVDMQSWYDLIPYLEAFRSLVS